MTVVVKDTSESATLGVMDSLSSLAEEIADCRQCERLVHWREKISVEKRAIVNKSNRKFGNPPKLVLKIGQGKAI